MDYDLNDPESVKAYIANLNKSLDYKRNLIAWCDHYAKFYKITWDRLKYKKTGNQKKAPLEQNVNFIMEHCRSFKRRVAFTIIKVYGLRPVELSKLTLSGIDLEQGLMYVKTAKYGNPKLHPNDLEITLTSVSISSLSQFRS